MDFFDLLSFSVLIAIWTRETYYIVVDYEELRSENERLKKQLAKR